MVVIATLALLVLDTELMIIHLYAMGDSSLFISDQSMGYF
jgi:hypothetical protein